MAKNNSNRSQDKVQDAIDSMYQATYYNSPKDKKDLESLTNKINQHINSITNYNMNSTGVPSTSRLYSRLRMATNKSPDGQKDMTELFDNAIGFEDFYSNFMQNRYLVEVDAEIDSVCKYFPELVEALEVKKEGVLSADHFSKDYLTVKNKAITEDNTEFNDEIDTLKDKYKLLKRVDTWYDNAAKYGEQYVYIVPYATALTRLLASKPNTDPNMNPIGRLSEGTLELENKNTRYTLSIREAKMTISKDGDHKHRPVMESACRAPITKNNNVVDYAPVVDLNERFDLSIEICRTGIIESEVLAISRSIRSKSSLTESLSSQFDREVLNEKGKLEIVKKNATTGELEIKGKENDLIANTSNDGLFTTKMSANQTVGQVNVPGCVLSDIKREQVIPIYVANTDTCLGYYYIELRSVEAMQDFQGYNYIMSDSLTSIRGSNSGQNAPFNVVDPQRQEQLLQYIAGQLSQFIDKEFIQNNQDLREEIYMILKQNDLFNTPSIDQIKVTFIPPEDMVHIYFKLDPDTHRGISDLEKAMVPAKIYACMYITDAIAQMVRGQDKRVFYVKQNVETNISKTLLNTIQQLKQGNFGLRQFSNINNVLNITGKFNDFIIPTNASGDSPVQIEVMPGQQFTDNTDRMQQLKEMAINSTDVPFEIIQSRQSVDYAMQLSMSSSRFLRKVYHRQSLYTPFLERIVTKLYNYEFGKHEDLDVILPPPMFINMANTNQLVDNIKQFITTTTEYEMNNIEDEKLKNTYMNELFRYYVGTHVELDEHEKIFTRAMMMTKEEAKPEEDNDNGY